ncbi:uncharacterized mitochondrial protein AtMg00810-like [Arachis duranensis]|uniref:Uncharacterized mitochondrial protein AtMg00810-like n=1 Tax=Arachis duranensis TaxID=130453 RepID=A0A6P4CFP9_ARADU|nr:uncharacterized mitochondrial protein AtMg00810-like [Arachis duranensis]
MRQPQGYVEGDGKLLGFTATTSDVSVFTKFDTNATTFVLVYVDDMIITGSSTSAMTVVVNQLNCIQVSKTKGGGLLLSQEKYDNDLLGKAGMTGYKPCKTPLPSSLKISQFGGDMFDEPALYRLVVGSLQYLTITRPELAYAVGKLSQFMQDSLESHWKLVKRIFRYASETIKYGLHLHKNDLLNITAYCDSDWGGDPDDRKSIGGMCVFLGRNLVSWSFKKQSVVARSSTEAEYRAMADLVAELIWIKNLLSELKVTASTPTIYCNNLSAMLLAANPILHSKSKHFETDLHFVRDYVSNKVVQVSHVLGSVQLEDILTKAIASGMFKSARARLNIEQNLLYSATAEGAAGTVHEPAIPSNEGVLQNSSKTKDLSSRVYDGASVKQHNEIR